MEFFSFFWIFPCVHFTKGPPQREIEINMRHQSLFFNLIDTPGFFEDIVVNILLHVTFVNPKNFDKGRSFEFLKLPEFQAGPRAKSWLLSLVQQCIAGDAAYCALHEGNLLPIHSGRVQSDCIGIAIEKPREQN